MRKTYGASEFKARCLQLLDKVKETGEEYIITKRGVPMAKLGPVEGKATRPLRGLHKGLVEVRADIVGITFEDDWEALKK
ncbi:MAG: type II toxin-antitoxin system Phd/YefM family antitoxin [Acidobacteriota bacterium]